jgi:hypothetical protein
MAAKTAYKPTTVETQTHITTAQTTEAALKTANPKKNVARPADPYIGGESFDYAT